MKSKDARLAIQYAISQAVLQKTPPSTPVLLRAHVWRWDDGEVGWDCAIAYMPTPIAVGWHELITLEDEWLEAVLGDDNTRHLEWNIKSGT